MGEFGVKISTFPVWEPIFVTLPLTIVASFGGASLRVPGGPRVSDSRL